jgi:hypothetical protein
LSVLSAVQACLGQDEREQPRALLAGARKGILVVLGIAALFALALRYSGTAGLSARTSLPVSRQVPLCCLSERLVGAGADNNCEGFT